jgi:hypothetical protein
MFRCGKLFRDFRHSEKDEDEEGFLCIGSRAFNEGKIVSVSEYYGWVYTLFYKPLSLLI